MNDYELMKLSEYLDEAIDLGEYTPQEIEEMIKLKQKNKSKTFKEKYFEFYDDVKSSSKKHEDW